MSTDITIEASPDAPPSFDDFVRDDVPVLARAVTLIADDPALANAAMTAGLQSTHDSWASFGERDQARQHLFSVAVARCRADLVDDKAPVLQQACVVARHVFAWNASTTAVVLDLEHRYVVQLLGAAKEHALPGLIADHVHEAIAAADPADYDIDAITGRDAARTRRRIGKMAIGALVVLFMVGGLAQCIARPDRAATADSPRPTALAATTPTAPAPSTPPVPVAAPTLITTDGDGGFVGVQPLLGTDTTAAFSRSPDGQDWQAVSTWDLGSPVSFSRFERSGEHFAVWIDDAARSPGAAIQLGISRNLTDWQLLGFATNDVEPVGLSYSSSITDLAIRGDTVLALARTEFEIDFAALSTSESYTCGHSLADDNVTVNLCNSELDVLSLSGIDQLPRRNRLFVSRAGKPFEPTSEPFSRETAVGLTTIGDAFAITDSTGIGFATADDSLRWQTIATGRPPFAVIDAATGDQNQVVGIGANADGSLAVFRTIGATTSATPLAEIIGELPRELQAVVTAGPTRWIIFLFEVPTPARDTRAWVLSSPDGLRWVAVPTTPPTGADVQVLPGDEQVVVQWHAADGALVTASVPLPL